MAAKKREEAKSIDWPIVKYNKPYKIEAHQWKEKSREARQAEIKDFDADPVIFEGPPNFSERIFF